MRVILPIVGIYVLAIGVGLVLSVTISSVLAVCLLSITAGIVIGFGYCHLDTYLHNRRRRKEVIGRAH